MALEARIKDLGAQVVSSSVLPIGDKGPTRENNFFSAELLLIMLMEITEVCFFNIHTNFREEGLLCRVHLAKE